MVKITHIDTNVQMYQYGWFSPNGENINFGILSNLTFHSLMKEKPLGNKVNKCPLIIFLMSLLSPNTSLRFSLKWVLGVFFNIFQDTIGRHGVVHARLESLAVCQPRGLSPSPSSPSLIHSPASLSYSSSQLIVSTLFLF